MKHFIKLLEALREDSIPLWGTLQPQAMVEHLTLGIKIGNGTLRPRNPVPWDDYDDARKEQVAKFTNSETPFSRNIMNPMMKDQPFQTRKPNLQEAKDWFAEELGTFIQYWEDQPDAVPMHPTLGPMGHRQWQLFQQRHITHHFIQFGLMPDQGA